MPNLILRPGWWMPESLATPESVYRNRRQFLREMGLAGMGLSALLAGCGGGATDPAPSPTPVPAPRPPAPASATPETGLDYAPDYVALYPAARNESYTLDRPETDEQSATTYINFYEFSTSKSEVHKLVDRFRLRPWEIEIAGLCEKPGVYDVYDLIARMPLEERLYRFRCVEAWAMALPFTGFPMRALLDHVGVKNEAAYVRFVTFLRPAEAPGFEKYKYPFPYYEALTLPEARNELSLLATGLYGKPLPKQNGAPLRVVAPWKYGLKSIKSLVRIEFTAERPPTFWNDVNGKEYDWFCNVDPETPHPRWSQQRERLVGTDEKRDTLLYNGYGDYVAQLYA